MIRFNGLNHNAVHRGGVSHVRAYHGSALVWEKETEPPAEVNLLKEYLTAGTALFAGVTLTVNADGTVLITGTATGQINAKISNGVDMQSVRPAAWNDESLAGIPLAAITLGAEVVSGTVTNAAGDSCNLTLRYSAETIFLNCKVGDGMYSIGGTPTAALSQCVVYIRSGTVFDSLLLRPYVDVEAA